MGFVGKAFILPPLRAQRGEIFDCTVPAQCAQRGEKLAFTNLSSPSWCAQRGENFDFATSALAARRKIYLQPLSPHLFIKQAVELEAKM